MRIVTIMIVLWFVSLTGTGCNEPVDSKGPGNHEDKKIQVAVSILPQVEFVKKIGKDKVQVEVMIPPGVAPATYEPGPGKLKNLSKAEMYVIIGNVPFEKAWMDEIKSANKEMKILDSSKGIEIVNKDPHIWLSPPLVKKQVEHIYKGLIDIDPGNKDFYEQNKKEFISELTELDREIKDTFSGISNRKFMVFHPSWGYFAREYELEQIPIEVEGKEPGAGEIAKFVKQAEKNDIHVIFASPQFNTKSAELIAKEIGGEVVDVDPLARDYLSNMRSVSEKFARSME